MKQKLLLLIFAFLSTTLVNAQTFTDNGINYNVTSATTVEVWDNTNFSGVANIPTSVTYGTTTYTVTNIADAAFFWNDFLTGVTIPNSVINIGDQAFRQCSGLTSIVIPNSVTNIGDQAFRLCNSLTSVIIPDSVTNIGNLTFDSCENLISVSIPNSVISIGISAFNGCNSLTSVTIPNSVTNISDRAFYNCTGLTSVSLPNSVINIGDSAFYNCTGLASVTLPNSITTIAQRTFYNCTSLTSVTIPNLVVSIGTGAFQSCTSLASIVIPNSVTFIGDIAFYNCTALTMVNCYIATPIAITQDVFGGTTNQAACTLNVPIGSETAYDAAAVWTNFNPINGNLLSNDSFMKNNFAMYPNPSNGVLNISLENNLQLGKVNFYNQLGQLVKTATTPVIATSDLAKGSYFVEVITNEGKAIKQLVTN